MTAPLTYRGAIRVFLKAKNSRTLAWLQGSYDKPYDIWVSATTNSASASSAISIRSKPTTTG